MSEGMLKRAIDFKAKREKRCHHPNLDELQGWKSLKDEEKIPKERLNEEKSWALKSIFHLFGSYVGTHLPEFSKEDGKDSSNISLEDRDSMFDEAARVIVSNQQGSASLLQRKLKLGYNRAGRLIDQMEDAGIVGPFEGSKPRQVLITDLNSLESLLSEIKN